MIVINDDGKLYTLCMMYLEKSGYLDSFELSNLEEAINNRVFYTFDEGTLVDVIKKLNIR